MLNGVEEFALLDTGYEVSLVKRRIAKGLEIEHSGLRLMADNHTHIDIQGEVDIPFRIDELDLPTPALVSDRVRQIMLGIDFLAGHECLWNFSDRTLMIDGHTCKLHCRSGSSWCRSGNRPRNGRRTFA